MSVNKNTKLYLYGNISPSHDYHVNFHCHINLTSNESHIELFKFLFNFATSQWLLFQT